ncbi:WXG100 family type VII secretion target [Micromonospora sp. DT233]|uniref:WXG100 family type VII secretion target n=1 Tax=Micromonospora sp. DT233 TaxID=3393432 RepID=UPI003CF75AFB
MAAEVAPQDYAGKRIVVNTAEVKKAAQGLDLAAKLIEQIIKDVHDTWAELKLGWTGQTQAEAEEFNALWQKAMTEMFGSKEGERGALPTIHYMANAAAANYANTEDWLRRRIYEFGQAVVGDTTTVSAELPPEIPEAKEAVAGKPDPNDPAGDDRDRLGGPIWEWGRSGV